ncbi:MAG: hypothetical protein HFE57_07160 [Firmicutes bacterium]|nr:hypothetical protein [Bacillota bacterium]
MKYFKRLLYILIAIFCIFIFVGYTIPQKTNIEKSLNCFDEVSKKKIMVTISGTYYSYFLTDDVFKGIIIVEGKRSLEREYTLRDDLYTNFVDEYGQPEGMILQFKKFSYINIYDLDYYLYSEWDTAWTKEFKQKMNW